MFATILRYALRNIRRTPLRSFFTLFSVSLIIMLYTVLTSVGNSFTHQISRMLEQQDIDIVVQAKYAATPVTSIIDNSTVKGITKIDGIHSYDSLLIGKKRLEGKSRVFILGVSDFNTFAQRLGFNITKGRAMSDGAREIVVGDKMAKVFGVDVGDEVELDSNKKYLIVGIYSSWLNFLNAGIVINVKAAQELMHKPDKISLLFLTLDDTTKTSKIIHEINKQFPDMRAIESQQLPNYLGAVKNMFYFSKIVSVMTLIIAVAVLLNTFIMAINERTKEIGILSAIGWPRHMIVMIFLTESLLLSFSGGIIGYLCAYPVMWILLRNFASISMFLPDAPTIGILIDVLLMSFFVGLLSVLFPALYGTKINIAKAIHHE